MTTYQMPTPVYQKTLLIGKAKSSPNVKATSCDVELEITLRPKSATDDRIVFSIMSSVWKPNRSDIIAGGQLRGDDLRGYIAVRLIGKEKLNRILQVCDEWHLNDMKPGCEHQRASASHQAWFGGWSDYSGVRMGYPRCQCCGYSYGSKWLFEEMPAELIEEIKSW